MTKITTTSAKREQLVLTDMHCGALMSVGGMLFVNHKRLYDAGTGVYFALLEAKYIRVNADGMYAISDEGRAAIGRTP